jgi:hypothetical protein
MCGRAIVTELVWVRRMKAWKARSDGRRRDVGMWGIRAGGNVEMCDGEMGASGVSDVGVCSASPDRCWGGVGATRAT